MSTQPTKIITEMWQEELKNTCPLKSCQAPPGELCKSRSVFVHFERFKLAEDLQSDNVRDINQPRLPGLQA